jgi:hypothetical protein
MSNLKIYLKKIHTLHLSAETTLPAQHVLAYLCKNFCAEHPFKYGLFNYEPAQLHSLLAQQLKREINLGGDFLTVLNRQLAKVKLDKESDFYFLLKAFFHFYVESYGALENSTRHNLAIEFANLPTSDADISRLLTLLECDGSTPVARVQVINLLSILHNRQKPATQKNITTKLIAQLSNTDQSCKAAALQAVTKLAPLPFESFKTEIVVSLRNAMYEPQFAESHIGCLVNLVPVAHDNFIKTVFNTILARYSRLLRERDLEELFQTLCKNNISGSNDGAVRDWLINKLFEQLNFFETKKLYDNLYKSYFKLFRHIAHLASGEILPTVANYCLKIIREKKEVEITQYAFCILSQLEYNFSVDEKELIFQYIAVDLKGHCLGLNHAIVSWISKLNAGERQLELLKMFLDKYFALLDEAIDDYMPVLGELIRKNNELFMEVAKPHLGINLSRPTHWVATCPMLVKAREFVEEDHKKVLNELFWSLLFKADGDSNFNVSYDFRKIVSFFPQEIIHDNLTRLVPPLLIKVEISGLLDALFVNTLLASNETHALKVLRSITAVNDCKKLQISFREIIRRTSSLAIKKYLTHYFYQQTLVDMGWVHWLCFAHTDEQTHIVEDVTLQVLQKDFPDHSLYLTLLTLRVFNYEHFEKKYDNKVGKLDNIINIAISYSKRSSLRMRHLAGEILGLYADKLTDDQIKNIISRVNAELFILDKVKAVSSVRIITSLSPNFFQRETMTDYNMVLITGLLAKLDDSTQADKRDITYATLLGLCPAIATSRRANEYMAECFKQLSAMSNAGKLTSEEATVIIISLLQHAPLSTKFNFISLLMANDSARSDMITHRELWLTFMRNIPLDERNYFLHGTVLNLVDQYRNDDAKFIDALEFFFKAEQEIQCHMALSACVNDVKAVAELIQDYAKLAI